MTTEPIAKRPLSGLVAAGDADQARLIAEAVSRLLALNAWLRPLVEVQRDRIIGVQSKSEAKIITADVATSWGHTPHFIVADEVSIWGNRGLWDSLLSSAAKRSDCLILAIGNAGWCGTWQWETREAIRRDSEWHFHALAGPVASWISRKRLDEQERLLPPAVFGRVWGNRWASGDGDAIDDAWLSRALTAAGPLEAPEPHWRYAAGLDLGLRHDFSALVVVGKHTGGAERLGEVEPKPMSRVSAILADLGIFQDEEGPLPFAPSRYRQIEGTGALKLAAVRVWKPRRGGEIDLGEVEREILDVHRRFGLAELRADKWQAAGLIQRLRKAGLKAEGIDFTGGVLIEQASILLEVLRESRVALFDSPELLSDLRSMRLVEKSYGTRLESPRSRGGGHGDVGTAFALGLWGAKKLRQAGPIRVNRPMVLDGS